MTYSHFFEPLHKQDVITAFPQWDKEFAVNAFNSWAQVYARKAVFLYTAQLSNRREELSKEFCRMFEIDDPEDISYYYRDEWHEFLSLQGFDEHAERVEYWKQHESLLFRQKYGSDFVVTTAKEMAEDFIARMTKTEVWPDDDHIEMSLWRLWFNTSISNSIDEAKRLKYMPYQQYLQTDHWKRIRSAMLLAHGARCQGDICENLDSYWFGGEGLLHVHHVTYKNRGNERFEDLRLLCTECHKKYHDTKISPCSEYADALYSTWSE